MAISASICKVLSKSVGTRISATTVPIVAIFGSPIFNDLPNISEMFRRPRFQMPLSFAVVANPGLLASQLVYNRRYSAFAVVEAFAVWE